MGIRLGTLLHDLGYAGRRLGRNPGFAATAILALGADLSLGPAQVLNRLLCKLWDMIGFEPTISSVPISTTECAGPRVATEHPVFALSSRVYKRRITGSVLEFPKGKDAGKAIAQLRVAVNEGAASAPMNLEQPAAHYKNVQQP